VEERVPSNFLDMQGFGTVRIYLGQDEHWSDFLEQNGASLEASSHGLGDLYFPNTEYDILLIQLLSPIAPS
jgi:hypothetical protein